MGARSDVEVVDQPWPVVYDALVQCAPTVGFRVVGADPARGQLRLETRNTRVTVAVGALDAVTTEWVATAEQKIGLFRDRHGEQFATIRDALATYLATYYQP